MPVSKPQSRRWEGEKTQTARNFADYVAPSATPAQVYELAEELRDGIRGSVKSYDIAKGNGGLRQIDQPLGDLLKMQRRMKPLLRKSSVPMTAGAFHPGRSAPWMLRQMGDYMLRREGNVPIRGMLQMDIDRFFNSIPQQRVREELWHLFFRLFHRPERTKQQSLRKKPSTRRSPELSIEEISSMATLAAKIACHDDGYLPQGPCTSPFIANCVGGGMDMHILSKIPDHTAFGRFADDCVWITPREGVIDDAFAREMGHIFHAHGFTPAHQKTEITGPQDIYNVLGMNILPPSEENPRGFRLRPRATDLKELKREMLDLIHDQGREVPMQPKKFMEDDRVKRILGHVSYAYSVTRYGNDALPSSAFLLPAKIAGVWGEFIKKFKHQLPEGYQTAFDQYEVKKRPARKIEKPVRELSQLDRRISNLCTVDADELERAFREKVVGKDHGEGFREEVRHARLTLKNTFKTVRGKTQVDADGTSYFAALAATLDELTEKYTDLEDQSDFAKTVRHQLVDLVAVIELIIDDVFTMPRSQENPWSILPLDLAVSWHAFRKKLGLKGRHCKPLDRKNELSVTPEQERRIPRALPTWYEWKRPAFFRQRRRSRTTKECYRDFSETKPPRPEVQTKERPPLITENPPWERRPSWRKRLMERYLHEQPLLPPESDPPGKERGKYKPQPLRVPRWVQWILDQF